MTHFRVTVISNVYYDVPSLHILVTISFLHNKKQYLHSRGHSRLEPLWHLRLVNFFGCFS